MSLLVSGSYTLKHNSSYNKDWVDVDLRQLCNRKDVDHLFCKLISSLEVNNSQPHNLPATGQPPIARCDWPEENSEKAWINHCLTNQRIVSRGAYLDSPYTRFHLKRQIVQQRIMIALASFYQKIPASLKKYETQFLQDPTNSQSLSTVEDEFLNLYKSEVYGGHSSLPNDKAELDSVSNNGSHLMTAVNMGLQTAFTLLRQNWILTRLLNNPELSSLSHDLLSQAEQSLLNIAPLSINNYSFDSGSQNSWSQIGSSAMDEIGQFLQEVALSKSLADDIGRRKCLELLIILATRRGTLFFLLDWLTTARQAFSSETVTYIDKDVMEYVLQLISGSAGLKDDHLLHYIQEARNMYRFCGTIPNDAALVPLNSAIYKLMSQLASSSSFQIPAARIPGSSTDQRRKSSPPSGSGQCVSNSLVFMWGSNSGQKITNEPNSDSFRSPKLFSNFKNVSQIALGSTFTLVVSNGVVSMLGDLGLSSDAAQPAVRPPANISEEENADFSFASGRDARNVFRSVQASTETFSSRRSSVQSGKFARIVAFPYLQVRVKQVAVGWVDYNSPTNTHCPHILACTDTGDVFSWGMGEFGRLGHGNTSPVFTPKKITGLNGTFVVAVSAGKRHSVCLTQTGEVYSWGLGSRLGIEELSEITANRPVFVRGLPAICQISCGAEHTLVLPENRSCVYGFGNSSGGRLGNQINSVLSDPQQRLDFIYANYNSNSAVSPVKMCGLPEQAVIKQVSAGNMVSAVILDHRPSVRPPPGESNECDETTDVCGQLFMCGSGVCLGWGGPNLVLTRANQLLTLRDVEVQSVHCGESHVLVITSGGLYGWGCNSVGELGLGMLQTPILNPQLIRLPGEDSSNVSPSPAVNCVYAGTYHSAAWYSSNTPDKVKMDESSNTQQRTCSNELGILSLEVRKSVIAKLRQLLEHQIRKLESECEKDSISMEEVKFTVDILKLLFSHIKAAVRRQSDATNKVLEGEKDALRKILFGMVDLNLPEEVVQQLALILTEGSNFLLPCVENRVDLVMGVLNSVSTWRDMSTGQRMRLCLCVHSLTDTETLSQLIGLWATGYDSTRSSDESPLEQLITILVRALGKYTVNCLKRTIGDSTADSPTEANAVRMEASSHWSSDFSVDDKEAEVASLLNDFLYSIYKHLLTGVCSSFRESHSPAFKYLSNVFFSHLSVYLTQVNSVLRSCMVSLNFAHNSDRQIKILERLLLPSLAGNLLSMVLCALLQNHQNLWQKHLNDHYTNLKTLLVSLDMINTKLTPTSLLENREISWPVYGLSTDLASDLASTPNQSLTQVLLDIERTAGLLIGCYLNQWVMNEAESSAEIFCKRWIGSPLFSNGLEHLNRSKQSNGGAAGSQPPPPSLSPVDENGDVKCEEIDQEASTGDLSGESVENPRPKLPRAERQLKILTDNESHAAMIAYAKPKGWPTALRESIDIVNKVSICVLGAALKVVNAQEEMKSFRSNPSVDPSPLLGAVFRCVFAVRQHIFSKINCEGESASPKHESDSGGSVNSNRSQPITAAFKNFCLAVITRCTHLLCIFRAPLMQSLDCDTEEKNESHRVQHSSRAVRIEHSDLVEALDLNLTVNHGRENNPWLSVEFLDLSFTICGRKSTASEESSPNLSPSVEEASVTISLPSPTYDAILKELADFLTCSSILHSSDNRSDSSSSDAAKSEMSQLFSAVSNQVKRCEVRLKALNAILDLMNDSLESMNKFKQSTDPTVTPVQLPFPSGLLNSVNFQLMAGSFGFLTEESQDFEFVKFHCLDQISAAPFESKLEIVSIAHRLLEKILNCLGSIIRNKDFSQDSRYRVILMLLHQISMHYRADDVTILVKRGLLDYLIELECSPMANALSWIYIDSSPGNLERAVKITGWNTFEVLILCACNSEKELSRDTLHSIVQSLGFYFAQYLSTLFPDKWQSVLKPLYCKTYSKSVAKPLFQSSTSSKFLPSLSQCRIGSEGQCWAGVNHLVKSLGNFLTLINRLLRISAKNENKEASLIEMLSDEFWLRGLLQCASVMKLFSTGCELSRAVIDIISPQMKCKLRHEALRILPVILSPYMKLNCLADQMTCLGRVFDLCGDYIIHLPRSLEQEEVHINCQSMSTAINLFNAKCDHLSEDSPIFLPSNPIEDNVQKQINGNFDAATVNSCQLKCPNTITSLPNQSGSAYGSHIMASGLWKITFLVTEGQVGTKIGVTPTNSPVSHGSHNAKHFDMVYDSVSKPNKKGNLVTYQYHCYLDLVAKRAAFARDNEKPNYIFEIRALHYQVAVIFKGKEDVESVSILCIEQLSSGQSCSPPMIDKTCSIVPQYAGCLEQVLSMMTMIHNQYPTLMKTLILLKLKSGLPMLNKDILPGLHLESMKTNLLSQEASENFNRINMESPKKRLFEVLRSVLPCLAYMSMMKCGLVLGAECRWVAKSGTLSDKSTGRKQGLAMLLAHTKQHDKILCEILVEGETKHRSVPLEELSPVKPNHGQNHQLLGSNSLLVELLQLASYDYLKPGLTSSLVTTDDSGVPSVLNTRSPPPPSPSAEMETDANTDRMSLLNKLPATLRRRGRAPTQEPLECNIDDEDEEDEENVNPYSNMFDTSRGLDYWLDQEIMQANRRAFEEYSEEEDVDGAAGPSAEEETQPVFDPNQGTNPQQSDPSIVASIPALGSNESQPSSSQPMKEGDHSSNQMSGRQTCVSGSETEMQRTLEELTSEIISRVFTDPVSNSSEASLTDLEHQRHDLSGVAKLLGENFPQGDCNLLLDQAAALTVAEVSLRNLSLLEQLEIYLELTRFFTLKTLCVELSGSDMVDNMLAMLAEVATDSDEKDGKEKAPEKLGSSTRPVFRGSSNNFATDDLTPLQQIWHQITAWATEASPMSSQIDLNELDSAMKTILYVSERGQAEAAFHKKALSEVWTSLSENMIICMGSSSEKVPPLLPSVRRAQEAHNHNSRFPGTAACVIEVTENRVEDSARSQPTVPHNPEMIHSVAESSRAVSPVSNQLIEMGFPPDHIDRARRAVPRRGIINSRGRRILENRESRAELVSRMASWMLENPEEEASTEGASPGSDAAATACFRQVRSRRRGDELRDLLRQSSSPSCSVRTFLSSRLRQTTLTDHLLPGASAASLQTESASPPPLRNHHQTLRHRHPAGSTECHTTASTSTEEFFALPIHHVSPQNSSLSTVREEHVATCTAANTLAAPAVPPPENYATASTVTPTSILRPIPRFPTIRSSSRRRSDRNSDSERQSSSGSESVIDRMVRDDPILGPRIYPQSARIRLEDISPFTSLDLDNLPPQMTIAAVEESLNESRRVGVTSQRYSNMVSDTTEDSLPVTSPEDSVWEYIQPTSRAGARSEETSGAATGNAGESLPDWRRELDREIFCNVTSVMRRRLETMRMRPDVSPSQEDYFLNYLGDDILRSSFLNRPMPAINNYVGPENFGPLFSSNQENRRNPEPSPIECELCKTSVPNLNHHMKIKHPGCGGPCERYGYRGNGQYVDAWFGGKCGTGYPFYLMCPPCRQKYLGQSLKKNGEPVPSFVADILGPDARIVRQSISYRSQASNFTYPRTCRASTRADRLGEQLCGLHLRSDVEDRDLWRSKRSSPPLSAQLLFTIDSAEDRVQSFRRITNVLQVTVARKVLFKALKQLIHNDSSQIPAFMQLIGLGRIEPIMKLIKLLERERIIFDDREDHCDIEQYLRIMMMGLLEKAYRIPKLREDLMILCQNDLACLSAVKLPLRTTDIDNATVISDALALLLPSQLVAQTFTDVLMKLYLDPNSAVVVEQEQSPSQDLGTPQNLLPLLNSYSIAIHSESLEDRERTWAMSQLVRLLSACMSASTRCLLTKPAISHEADLSGDLQLLKSDSIPIPGHQDVITCVAWQYYKELLASSDCSGNVRIWLPKSPAKYNRQIRTFQFQPGIPFNSSDQPLQSNQNTFTEEVDVGEEHGLILDFNQFTSMSSPACRAQSMESDSFNVELLEWNAQGSCLAAVSGRHLNIWCINNQCSGHHIDMQTPITTIAYPADFPSSGVSSQASISSERDVLAVGMTNGLVALIVVMENELCFQKDLILPSKGPASVLVLAWQNENGYIAVGYSDGSIRLVKRSEPSQCVELELAHEHGIRLLKYCPVAALNTNHLASVGMDDCSVKIWIDNIFTQQLTHPSPVTSLSWPCCESAQASHSVHEVLYVLSGTQDGQTFLWKLLPFDEEHECLLTLRGHFNPLLFAQISPDGLFLATGCFSGWINIWSLSDECVVQTILGEKRHDPICALHWTSEGLIFARNSSKNLEIRTPPTTKQSCLRELAVIRHTLRQHGMAVSWKRYPIFRQLFWGLSDFITRQVQCQQYPVHTGDQLAYCKFTQWLICLGLCVGLDKAVCRKPLSLYDWHTKGDNRSVEIRDVNPLGLVNVTAQSDSIDRANLCRNDSDVEWNWDWLQSLVDCLSLTECIQKRKNIPNKLLPQHLKSQMDREKKSWDNRGWSLLMDHQLISWFREHSTDSWLVAGQASLYLWGCGRQGQLNLSTRSKAVPPNLRPVSAHGGVEQIVCGQSVTFLINSGGNLYACGEGRSLPQPQMVPEDVTSFMCVPVVSGLQVVQVATSLGPESHHMALTILGEVYSWGDGSYGKLGHGSSERVKRPRQIDALRSYHAVWIACGHKHSAVVTSDGQLWTFGSGDYGRLGHERTGHRKVPEVVQGFNGTRIGSVACGLTHTVALSVDRKHIFSFGDNEQGKLGLLMPADAVRSKATPTLITTFQNVELVKVCCGNQFTVCLTKNQDVYTWGAEKQCGHPITTGSVNRLSNNGNNQPRLVKSLSSQGIVDISTGGDYTLVVTEDGRVLGWGSNVEGQLGLSPNIPDVQEPTEVPGLSGKGIKQVSCGRTHAAAWTCHIPHIPLLRPQKYPPITCPASIPAKYPSLQETQPQHCLSRLHLLLHWNSLLFYTWRYLPRLLPLVDSNLSNSTYKRRDDIITAPNTSVLFSRSYETSNQSLFNLLDCTATNELAVGCLKGLQGLDCPAVRNLLLPQVSSVFFSRALTKTVVHGKNYGPVITVRRLQKAGSIFTQTAQQILNHPPEALRLASRAWKVKLIGEAADDAGGVFDETLSEMCQELELAASLTAQKASALLANQLTLSPAPQLLVPNPNGEGNYLFNPNPFLDSRHFIFLGILLGIAIRTGKVLDLHLAECVWKLLVGLRLTVADLEEIDPLYIHSVLYLKDEEQLLNQESFRDLIPLDNFVGQSIDGRTVEIIPGGEQQLLTYELRLQYVDKLLHYRLHEMDRPVRLVQEGLASISPLPLLSLMTPQYLEELVCGLPEIEITTLKKMARYREFEQHSVIVDWLWDILESFNNEERVLFLRFISGRSRLPSNLNESQRFFILLVEQNMDSLPTAQTCFFQLRLPPYSSNEVMENRLRYAIHHCRSIDMDNYMLVRNQDATNNTNDSDF